MIWSLFSLFMVFVFVGEKGVEPVDTHAPLGNSVQETTEVKQKTQWEEDCRYHDGPIPRRDLSNYIVDSDRERESSDEKEIGGVDNEASPEAKEIQDVEVELVEPKTPNKEEQGQ